MGPRTFAELINPILVMASIVCVSIVSDTSEFPDFAVISDDQNELGSIESPLMAASIIIFEELCNKSIGFGHIGSRKISYGLFS